MARINRIPSGRKARNQVPQEISIPTVLFTSASASRFGARAERNIELVIQAAVIATHIRYEPILRALGSFGLEPYSGGRLAMIG